MPGPFSLSSPLNWIRFEKYNRYHAVLFTKSGMHWTVCGRNVELHHVRDLTLQSCKQCSHCRSRLKFPYLIPKELLNRKADLKSAET